MAALAVEEALHWASIRHAGFGQTYGAGPYSDHLHAVISRLVDLDVEDPLVLVSAALHDTVEDGVASLDHVRERFGDRVAKVVDLLTKYEGQFRREPWERIARAFEGDDPAVARAALLVKLADRASNIDACWRTRNPKLFMYHAEHKAFSRTLFGLLSEPAVVSMEMDIERMLGLPLRWPESRG